MSDMDWFDGIEKAEKYKRNYFKPGKYLVQLRDVISKKGQGHPYFNATCEIVYATPGSESKPGESCSFHVTFKPNTPAQGNVKEFMEAVGEGLAGKKVNIDKNGSAAICGPNKPFWGKLAWVEVRIGKQQKDKTRDFTFHDWTPASLEDYLKLAETRAAAGLPAFDTGKVPVVEMWKQQNAAHAPADATAAT